MNYIYYTLISKENPEVELKGCIDIDTIEDDQPECDYLQNDGRWDSQVPKYWETHGEDQTHLLDSLREIEVYEWDWISQALVDVVESDDEIFIREFDKAKLYMSYDGDFSSETAIKLPQGVSIENDYPYKK